MIRLRGPRRLQLPSAWPLCLLYGPSPDERAGGLKVSSELIVNIPALLLLPGEGFFFSCKVNSG